jgi:prefoldin subunit 5
MTMELLRDIERLAEIRRLQRALQSEADEIRSRLEKVLRAAGGRLAVGAYFVSLTEVPHPSYGKVVEELKRRHPEMAEEIEDLARQFQSASVRIDIIANGN